MDKNLTKLELWHEIQRQGMGDYIKENPEFIKLILEMSDNKIAPGVKFWRTG